MHTVFGLFLGLLPLVTAQTTGAGLNKAAKAAGKLYFGTAVDNPGVLMTYIHNRHIFYVLQI